MTPSLTGSSRRALLAKLAGGLSIPLGAGALASRELTLFEQSLDADDPNNVATGGTDVERTLTVLRTTVETAAGSGTQYVYDGRFPPETLRVPAGENFAAVVENDLRNEGTTVHWHGVPVPNEMDGVPGVTQDPIPANGSMEYRYQTSPPGTYLYHSHVGTQADQGLMGPLVFEADETHVDYDYDWVVLLTDFLTGSPPAGEYPDIPDYDALLINGRAPTNPDTLTVEEGDRVRLRICNASGATTYRVSLAGHDLHVAWTDGRPVEPHAVDSIPIGAAERYGVVLEADSPGKWELRASAMNGDDVGNPDPARAEVVYDGHEGNTPTAAPSDPGESLSLSDLTRAEPYTGIGMHPDRTYHLDLSRGPVDGSWAIDGELYPDADPLTVSAGEHVRFHMHNRSDMFHPMHLHGHFFEVDGVTKDTTLVWPHSTTVIDWFADNPGDWFFHCHNEYHLLSGMARVVRYEDDG